MMNELAQNFYEFDSFQVDVRRRLLLHNGLPVRLTPKAFEILLDLVQSGGRVISKDEMMTRIWPDCFVEEGNLAQNIFLLRRTLGERKNEHKFIITIPGVGYRFAPFVRAVASLTVRKVPAAGDRKVASIAVLPPEPLSENELDPTLGAGIADALIRKLCSLKLVKVIPTSTVLRLADRSPDLWHARSDFQADALLAGFYQRDGEQVRLSMQLIRAGEGMMLWAEKFDAEFTNLFALQDSLAEQVATALVEKLRSFEQPRLSVVRNRRRGNLRPCS